VKQPEECIYSRNEKRAYTKTKNLQERTDLKISDKEGLSLLSLVGHVSSFGQS